MADDLNSEMIEFVSSITTAMGLDTDVSVESIEDGTRIVITGEGSDLFLQRKAAGLDALQHVGNAMFRRRHEGQHLVVDCLDYRKGKDAELVESAKLLANRARETGEPQEIGPLNP